MPYESDMTWDDWVRIVQLRGRQAMQAAFEGRDYGYKEWVAFVDSRALADVATQLGRTEAEVTDMDNAFSGLNALANLVDTNADILRKFT